MDRAITPERLRGIEAFQKDTTLIVLAAIVALLMVVAISHHAKKREAAELGEINAWARQKLAAVAEAERATRQRKT
jgi:hypothetical protein